MNYIQLIINPGSTSTKVAIYHNDQLLIEQSLRHEPEELKKYPHIINQLEIRKALILAFLKDNHHSLDDFDVFVGRGGILKPIKESGTYEVNDQMVDELRHALHGEHASNLGAIIAYEFAKPRDKKAFIVDPVCVDEMTDIARISGLKGIERQSTFHALNQKAVAREHAKMMGKPYHDLNLIVCHLGGGISVGLHKKGKVVDVNNALGGDGPFSPERTGTIPTYPLINLCFSGKYSLLEVKKMLVGRGGLVSYLGTSNAIEIDKRIADGDKKAELYFRAMAYRVIKEIGSLYFVMSGHIDDILITGGLAYNKRFIGYLMEALAPIKTPVVYPGEHEMKALALGSLRVLRNEEMAHIYI